MSFCYRSIFPAAWFKKKKKDYIEHPLPSLDKCHECSPGHRKFEDTVVLYVLARFFYLKKKKKIPNSNGLFRVKV